MGTEKYCEMWRTISGMTEAEKVDMVHVSVKVQHGVEQGFAYHFTGLLIVLCLITEMFNNLYIRSRVKRTNCCLVT